VETDLALQIAIASCYSREAAEKWQQLLDEAKPNWAVLADYASDLGLAPLLYDTIRRSNESLIPVEILADLRKQYYDTAGINLLILRELVAVLRSFDAVGLDVVVLKGAALIQDVYERLAFRPMVDLDLLIRFEDLELAKEQLEQLGYGLIHPAPFHDESGLFWNEIMLAKQTNSGPAIELHWHLLDNPYYATRLKTESLIGRSRQLSVADVAPRVLNLEDQIIHLCCHNLYHHLGRFTRSLVDIAFLVAKYGDQIRWEDITQRSEESETTMALSSAVEQLSDNWYTPIPEFVIDKTSAWKRSTRQRLYARSQENEYFRALRTLTALPGSGNKMRYVKGQLFPERGYIEWRYGLGPDTPLPVGYIRRYLSGLGGIGRAIVRRPHRQ
jgi:hypothetical protein